MKKITSVFILIFIFIGSTFSQQRNLEQAYKTAFEFLKSENTLLKTTKKSLDLSLVYTNSGTNIRSSKADANYYVFNIDKTSGFIIVSGDDRAVDILGYSDESYFDENNLSDNFKYWLSCYQKEIELLKKSGSILKTKDTKQTYASSVAPLLGNIKWNQNSPYNNLCPIYSGSNRAVTGCVATAMAQIMKYHKWPIQGIGSNSYTTGGYGISLSVDFSQTTYDWDNMTPSYNSQSSVTENNAVATLMYHCGVSVNMNYGPESGASTDNAQKALVNNFNYDKTIQNLSRDYFSKKDWNDIIKKEIDEKRPVLYSGSSTTGAHAFVCDGYDSSGLFHINWGWGGSADGYFALSALTPSTQGIGGSSGGYNFGQGAIIGIQKDKGSTNSPVLLVSTINSIPSSNIDINQNFQVDYGIRNRALDPITVTANLALYDDNDNFVTTLYSGMTTAELKTGYGYNNIEVNNCKIPTSTEDGTYKLYVVYRKSSGDSWSKALSQLGGYAAVTVNGSTVKFETTKPELKLQSLVANGKLYAGKTGNFEAVVANDGNLDLRSMVALKLVSKTDGSTYYMANDPAVIGVGETETINFSSTIDAPAGNYNLYLLYNITNRQSTSSPNYNDYETIGDPVEITINAAPVVNKLELSILSASFPDNNNVTPNTFSFTVNVKNTGDYFDNKISLYYNNPNDAEKPNTYYSFDSKNIILEPNETGSYTFTTAPGVSAGQYRIALLYNDINNQTVWAVNMPFTLKDDITTNIEETTKDKVEVIVYPNPATDKLYVNTEYSINKINIYNLSGKQVLSIVPDNKNNQAEIDVQDLLQGTYILRVVTENRIQNIKFIKK